MHVISRIVSGAVVALSFAASALAQPVPADMPPVPPPPPADQRPITPRPPMMPPFMYGDEWSPGQDISQTDPIMLARQMFHPGPELSTKLLDLNTARQKDLADMREKVNQDYVDKVKGLLTDDQKKQFEAAEAAFATYRQKMQAAEAELAATGGDRVVQAAKMNRLGSRTDLSQYLELTPDQRQKVSQLQVEMVDEMSKARQALPPIKPGDNQESIQKYQQAMKAATEKAQADFQEKRKALLTQEQLDKLAKMDEAAKAYGQKAQQAMSEMQDEFMQAMGRAPMPRPTANPPAAPAEAPAPK